MVGDYVLRLVSTLPMADRNGRTVVEGAEGRARSLARTLFLFLFLRECRM